jgi:hypothetical protein
MSGPSSGRREIALIVAIVIGLIVGALIKRATLGIITGLMRRR